MNVPNNEVRVKGFPLLTMTNGSGLWSNVSRTVKITMLEMLYVAEHDKFISLNAYFDTADWDIDEYGLIYTDELWIESFREALVASLDVPADAVQAISYSEQGMQGRDYINLDCGATFFDYITQFHKGIGLPY